MVVGRDSEEFLLNAPSVILTAGGYEASRELSRQYLGAIWERARVKGTPFDIGDMIKMAHTEEYGNDIVEKIVMSGMEELTDKVVEQGLQDKTLLLKTVVKYNLVVDQHQLENPKLQWNPGIKDGLSTQSLTMSLPLLKSNWTISIIKISFLAVKVACVKALWECKP
ncbi:hypothetical protein J3A83DRAFT_4426395 [Scleroderma citrinum]